MRNSFPKRIITQPIETSRLSSVDPAHSTPTPTSLVSYLKLAIKPHPNLLTTGSHQMLSQLERLGLHPIKQVRMVNTLPQLHENVHESGLISTTKCTYKDSSKHWDHLFVLSLEVIGK